MATIKDVAKKAGVSISVVSRAFNNYPDINAKTREKIFEIAKELNYTPNIVAKSLSSKRQKTIGLIASGIFTENTKDTISFEILKGVYTGVQENDYELSIFLIDSFKQEQKSYAQFCRDRKIGGIIVQGIRTDDPYFHELMDTNIPCVMIDLATELDNQLIGSVTSDNFGASRELASYLLEKNHRDIVVMAGTKETYVNAERFKGTKSAFDSYGLELADEDVLYAEFSEHKAYLLAKKYLQVKRPTAFICYSDLMAYGVMKAVKEKGLRVPDDISVVGFDDLMVSDFTQPRLTTIRQDFFEMGKQSALLVQQMMEKKEGTKQKVVNCELMERDSATGWKEHIKEEEKSNEQTEHTNDYLTRYR
ncbi:LacI family transcriptional regulator/LacI family purine nucleotide synthesis repressor [Salirhabdus euzebyi]|uniref:LacI family transcriptional regulator/LacI family purine nucleotide synthesis repressor n=1 Tax=Salirhabdus euzebyi TaxID=394506 RepID=A0A841Q4C3_9BACI|nr:LacI family DNA-binding transcriptional regulator [Salirhabdus euzebyi]MBB6453237.1 LacI family transcriptional regulator/LacI family purine nucleotide synthesis repressor [Salirhabdus euzebyi]